MNGSDETIKKIEAEFNNLIDEIAKRTNQPSSDRKQDRSKRREREIQRAALRVFARDGISRSRIQDIASEAGMPVSTLYEYFSSKEELAYLIPKASFAEYFSECAAAVKKEKTAGARLRLYLCMAADFARRNPDWARVLYLEIWPSVLISESSLSGCLNDYVRVIIALIRQGAQLGEWAPESNPYEIAAILNGSVNQVIITALLYRKPRDLSKAAAAIVDRTMTLLRPATAKKPSAGRPRMRKTAQ